MYGLLTNDHLEGEHPIEHNDWIWLRQCSEHMYMYIGKDLDDPLLAFNNWENGCGN